MLISKKKDAHPEPESVAEPEPLGSSLEAMMPKAPKTCIVKFLEPLEFQYEGNNYEIKPGQVGKAMKVLEGFGRFLYKRFGEGGKLQLPLTQQRSYKPRVTVEF